MNYLNSLSNGNNFFTYLILSPIINMLTTFITNTVQSTITWLIRLFTMRIDLSAKSVIYFDVMDYINSELVKSNTVVPEYDLLGGNNDDENYRRTTPKSSFWLNLGGFNYIYVVPSTQTSTSMMRNGNGQFGISSTDIKTVNDISIYFFPRYNCIERLNNLINKSKEFHQNKQKVTIYENSGGAWIATKTLNPRNMKTVYLPKQIESDILDCIQNFQTDQTFFRDNGFASRYTFLFSGLPGVGKTSTIISLASQLNMDIYYLSLKSKISDFMTIGQLMNNIKKDSILMIEDLDRTIGKHIIDQKNSNPNGLSMFGQMNDIDISDLLNCFDGVMSPNNVLIFITANNTDNLPSALLRPGRVNKHIKFPAITEEVFNKIVVKFYEDQINGMLDMYNQTLQNILAKKVSVAKIMDTIIETRRLKMGIEYFLNELMVYDPATDIGYVEGVQAVADAPKIIKIDEPEKNNDLMERIDEILKCDNHLSEIKKLIDLVPPIDPNPLISEASKTVECSS